MSRPPTVHLMTLRLAIRGLRRPRRAGGSAISAVAIGVLGGSLFNGSSAAGRVSAMHGPFYTEPQAGDKARERTVAAYVLLPRVRCRFRPPPKARSVPAMVGLEAFSVARTMRAVALASLLLAGC